MDFLEQQKHSNFSLLENFNMIKNTTLTYVEIFKPYKMVNFKNKWAAMLIKQSRTTTNMKKLHNCILSFDFSVS